MCHLLRCLKIISLSLLVIIHAAWSLASKLKWIKGKSHNHWTCDQFFFFLMFWKRHSSQTHHPDCYFNRLFATEFNRWLMIFCLSFFFLFVWFLTDRASLLCEIIMRHSIFRPTELSCLSQFLTGISSEIDNSFQVW